MAEVMRAWQYSKIEGTLEESITLKLDLPTPKKSALEKDETIVEVICASLNPVDYKLPESGLIGRIMITRPAIPGLDFCGRVVSKHPSVTAVELGQMVFGGYSNPSSRGTLAEYIVVSQSNCAPLPSGIDVGQAAAVGTAATTAYQSLIPESLKPGARVFINGGSGGVGTWTVQLAKAMGAQVVATCSTGNVELCKLLGADEVIDYKKDDVFSYLKSKGAVFDLLIDNVGSSTELYDLSDQFLKLDGTFVQVGVGKAMTTIGSVCLVTKQLRPLILGGRQYYFVNMKNSSHFFSRIGSWMAEGKAKAIIDSCYPLEDVPHALKRIREGQVQGKIVINVSR